MQLQKMLYEYNNKVIESVCGVDLTSHGGEYTLCGNAIPDNTLESFGCEPIGEPYSGSLKQVTCKNCLAHIKFVKGLT